MRTESIKKMSHLYYPTDQCIVFGSENEKYFYFIDLNVVNSQNYKSSINESKIFTRYRVYQSLNEFKNEILNLNNSQDKEHQTSRSDFSLGILPKETFRDSLLKLDNDNYDYLKLTRKQISNNSINTLEARKQKLENRLNQVAETLVVLHSHIQQQR